MNMLRVCKAAIGLLIGVAPLLASAQGPVELKVDDLKTPLGIDDPAPRFSWQLQDPARAARQTAYEVEVATKPELLETGKPDIWSSGRVTSGHSLNVRLEKATLVPSTRYYWRVKVWGEAGKPYAPSEISWWETGLMRQDNWHAAWIGYETPEEDAVRHAAAAWISNPDARAADPDKSPEQHVAYRQSVVLSKPIKSAALYATGQDTVAVWVNGNKVLTADVFPPWKQMPWKKFVRADVRSQLAAGANTIAIETTHYIANPNGMAAADAPPMIATLFVEYADGSTATFNSTSDWKTAIHAPAGWEQKAFDDSTWKHAIAWTQQPGPMNAPLGHPWIPDSVKALHRDFRVAAPVKSARLYSTAFGAYEIFLDGKRVSDEVLAPGWTDFREHIKYQTYDVSEQLKQGANNIEVLLAPGWYETPLEWFQQPNNYGDTPPALRAQLRIEYEDGRVEWVNTDPAWKAIGSYITRAELYDGETQDARRYSPFRNYFKPDPSGKTISFVDFFWKGATVIHPKEVPIEAQDFEPIRIEKTLTAKSMTEPKPGVYVYDFGQNFSGVEHLHLKAPAGTEVTARFAEIVNADGTIYTENLRTAKATDRFILSGNGVEEVTPQFTYHGFRYIELTGLPAAPPIEAVKALVFHTDAPFTVRLETGSTMINKLWSNILWGQRSNFVGVPSDCPQRDERLGWMADAQVFWRTASYNMALAPFSRKFGGDMRGTQSGTPYYGIYSPGTATESAQSGAGWSDAGIIIPWTSWLQTGDTSVIDQNWAAMEKYLASIDAANPDGLWAHQSGIPFGDWLSPEGKTNYTLIATAYWAYDLTLMEQMARATGRTADAEKYARLLTKIKVAFEKKFVHDDGYVEGADNSPSPFGDINNPNAKSNGGDTQAGYVLALHMNLVPRGTPRQGRQKARRQDRREPWPARHRLPRHAVSA